MAPASDGRASTAIVVGGAVVTLEELEARAAERATECGELREALAATFFERCEPPDLDEARAIAAAGESGKDDLEVSHLAWLAHCFAQSSETFQQRWEGDVLGAVPEDDHGVTAKVQALEAAKLALEKAQAVLEVKTEKKIAAALALNTAMAEEDDEDQDSDHGHAESVATPRSARSITPTQQEKKKRGWGANIAHNLKKIQNKDRSKKGSISPKGKAPENDTSPATAPGTPFGSPKRTNRRVQELNDELVELAEELQTAKENVESLTHAIEALEAELARGADAEEEAHGRGVREAVREAALALEEWAGDTRKSAAVLRARLGVACQDDDVHGANPGDSPQPSDSIVGEACLSSMSTTVSEGELDEEAVHLEHRAERLSRKNEELLRALPPRRRCLGARGSALSTAAAAPAWERDSGAGGSSPSNCDTVASMAKENAALEAELRVRRPADVRAALRRSCEALEREVAMLDAIAGSCSRLGPQFRRLSGRAVAQAAAASAASAASMAAAQAASRDAAAAAACAPSTPKVSTSVAAVGVSPASGASATSSAASGGLAAAVAALGGCGGLAPAAGTQSPRWPTRTLRPQPLQHGVVSSSESLSSPSQASSFSASRLQSPAFGAGGAATSVATAIGALPSIPRGRGQLAVPGGARDPAMSPVVEFRGGTTPDPSFHSFGDENPFEAGSDDGQSQGRIGNPFGGSDASDMEDVGGLGGEGNPFGDGGVVAGNPFEGEGGGAGSASEDDRSSEACNPFDFHGERPDAIPQPGVVSFAADDAGNPFGGLDGDSDSEDAEDADPAVTPGLRSQDGGTSGGVASVMTEMTFAMPQGAGHSNRSELLASPSPGPQLSSRPRRSPAPSIDELTADLGDEVLARAPAFGDARSDRFFMADRSPVSTPESGRVTSGEASTPERIAGACGGSAAASPTVDGEGAIRDALQSGTPRSTMACRMPSMSPRSCSQPRAAAASGLAGCLGACGGGGARRRGQASALAEQQVERAFNVPSMVLALARSDFALHRGRLGNQEGNYWEWTWRDFAAEEHHNELQKCTQSVSESLGEDDWSLFAYELLLLLSDHLSEHDPAHEHVRAVMPLCRVSLRINMLMHHRLADLTLPDGSQRYNPFDVRFRAAILLRSWVRAETAGFGADESELTTAWVKRQLAVLKGSVLDRAYEIYAASRQNMSAKIVCASCLQTLRALDEHNDRGLWGRPPEHDHHGEGVCRRAIVELMQDLDALRPSGDVWRFNKLYVAKVFGQLWRAATDQDTEDRLSLDAPAVAAALLSGLQPHLAWSPLQLETHGALLAQQIWLTLSAGRCIGSTPAAGFQLPAEALSVAADVVSDFSQWIQRQELGVNTAALFARKGESAKKSGSEEAAELIARRLLTVELRDGLVEALKDYRRHLEPSSFAPALALWRGLLQATARSERLVQMTPEKWRPDDMPLDEPGGRGGEDDALFSRRMVHYFIHSSVAATAELALVPFDEPVQVPNSRVEWNRFGPRIKKHVEGLAGVVDSLLDELECEKRYYGEAWDRLGFGADHLGVTAAALTASVRPRVELLLQCGMWPVVGAEVVEIPAGGGRLLRALETLDRRASRHPDPCRRPAVPLVDIVLPSVSAALAAGFRALDQDITSHALSGTDSMVFQPIRPPTLLYCDGVVTLWRFVHDTLDAPLSLGVPVDIVVPPFLEFLTTALDRARRRLVRPCEENAPFRMAARTQKILGELGKNDYDSDSDEDDPAWASGAEGDRTGTATHRKKHHRKFPKFGGASSKSRKQEDEATKNVIVEADLLEVEARVTAPPIHEVAVRMSSLGFCLTELDGVYNKLCNSVNSGDDSDVPTLRHNDARRRMCEELPELQDSLRERGGHALARYLAQRLVYFELRQDLFERMYFLPIAGGGETTRPGSATATPVGGDFGGGVGSAFFMPDAGQAPQCVSLESIIIRRQDGFLGLVAQTPPPMIVPFVVELGVQLAGAWIYVVLDYLRRSKLDRASALLSDDFEALKRLFKALMLEARKHIIANTQAGTAASIAGKASLTGLCLSDCDQGQRKLDETLKVAQVMVLKVHSGRPEELARYAGRLFGEDRERLAETQAAGAGGESRSERGRGCSPEVVDRIGDRGGRHSPEGPRSRKGGLGMFSAFGGGGSSVADRCSRSASPRRPPVADGAARGASPSPATPGERSSSVGRHSPEPPSLPYASPADRGGGDKGSGHRHKSGWKKAVSIVSKKVHGSTPNSARSKAG